MTGVSLGSARGWHDGVAAARLEADSPSSGGQHVRVAAVG